VFGDFEIISQSPTGQVLNTVSSVTLNFNDVIGPASLSVSDFTLVTPAGALPSSSLSVSLAAANSVQLSFPIQNLVGTYTIEAAADVTNLFGTPLALPYSGTFSISLPTISGTVTNANGAPQTGFLIQPNGGLTGAMTDINGNYSIGVPSGWSGTVTPSFGTNVFVPSSLSYTNVTALFTNQNYLIVNTVVPALTTGLSGSNLSVTWTGVSGVTYQVLWSTNLFNWQPLGNPILGTNGLMQILLPTGSNAASFYQLSATY
jgi:hypothetical protein